jgi:hypothetical protein
MGMIGNSLAQGLISGANIQDGTVDTPDIKDSAVTAAKIASAVVTPAKMDFSAGTANGVGYLNGSKVLTTGSALVFDGTSLKNVSSSSGATPSANGNQLVLESSGNAGLTIATGASSLGNIFFADSGDAADGFVQYDQSGRSLRFGTATAEKMRLDSSGNLGLGVTPATWLSTQKAFDIGTYGAVASSSGGAIRVTSNAYLNSSASWIYKNTAAATLYEQDGGVHTWKYAPSGTAGNTFTFTQAMTLDASGNLSSTGFQFRLGNSGNSIVSIARGARPSAGSSGLSIYGGASTTVNDAAPAAYITLSSGALGDTYEGGIGYHAYGNTSGSGYQNAHTWYRRTGVNTESVAMQLDPSGNLSILGSLAFGSFAGGLGKVGSFSRVVNAATGTVSYTGVGFRPSTIIFLATVDTVPTQSIGFTSATAGRCLYIDSTYSSGGGSYSEAIHMVRTIAGNGALQTAVISSMDSDGFTLSWTKTDLGSGGNSNAITVSYLAFR